MKIRLLHIVFLSLMAVFCFAQKDKVDSGKTTSLVTFNIRYDTPKDSLNSWANRKAAVCDFLRAHDLDIICLQEVLKHQLEDIVSSLPAYSYVGRERTDGEESGEFTPILFRSSKYQLLASGTFWLSQHPDSIGKRGWDAAAPRTATWTKLKEKNGNGKEFYVVNTHLDHKGKKARVQGMRQLKDFLHIPASEYPIIQTGDMNSSEKSPAYNIALTRNFSMSDAYMIANKRRGVGYSYHAFGRKKPVGARVRCDHVFVTNGIKVAEIEIPREAPANGVYLSDHNPVLVNLVVN